MLERLSDQVSHVCCGAGKILACLRRFWAVAAGRNSSFAPRRPRKPKQPLSKGAFEVSYARLLPVARFITIAIARRIELFCVMAVCCLLTLVLRNSETVTQITKNIASLSPPVGHERGSGCAFRRYCRETDNLIWRHLSMFRISCSPSLRIGGGEPESLVCSNPEFCPVGADARQLRLFAVQPLAL